MYFQFLVEDHSGEVLIRQIMSKFEGKNDFQYDIKAFKGIGGFKKDNSVKNIKTNKILNDLPQYLRAFNKKLSYFKSAIFVVVDNDDKDTEEFKRQLEAIADMNSIKIDHVFCIAVEEMEAWLLGDREAVISAYPNARMSVYKNYRQDSICGTWETLADVVYRGGLKKLNKDCQTYGTIGKLKAEWAENIGEYMDFGRNRSASFNYFINEISKRLDSGQPEQCREKL